MRPNLATDPGRRDASAAAFVARLQRWWGAALPSGTVTLVLADVSAVPAGSAEDSVDEVARAHRGHCVSPADDGPLMAAFASAEDGFDAARELAGRFGARVAACHGRGGAAGRQLRGSGRRPRRARLLELAARGQVVIDDATAAAIGDRLPPEIGLAELPETAGERWPAWALVGSGLAIPPRAGSCPYRGLMAFRAEDGDLFFGREEVVAIDSRAAPRGRLHGRGRGVGEREVVARPGRARPGLPPSARRHRRGDDARLGPGGGARARAVDAGRPSLLVVDQLEEAFTLCPDEADASALLRRADRPARGRLDVRRGRPPSGLLRALRRASAPRRGAGRAPAPARARCSRTSCAGRSRVPPARRGSDSRPAWSTRCWPTSKESPARCRCSPTPSTSRGLRRDGRVLTTAGYRAAGGVRGAIAHTAEEVFLGCSRAGAGAHAADVPPAHRAG